MDTKETAGEYGHYVGMSVAERMAADQKRDAARERHAYTSTACQHDQHDRCRRFCKFCDAPCECLCHRPREVDHA